MLILRKKATEEKKAYRSSDRFAYKTSHKDPIYIPVNRLQTPYQTEHALSEDKIQENMVKMKSGVALEPVVVGYNYDVHDGHNRRESAIRLGHTHVPCIVGGTNEKRVKAAEIKYRKIWKSETATVVAGGKVLILKKKDSGDYWVTIRGRHILYSKDGDIVSGHLPFDDKKKEVFKISLKEVEKKLSSHFIREHIGKSDKELKSRLKDTTISANSTFKDKATALKAIHHALNENFESIQKWASTKGSRAEKHCHYQGKPSEVIGRGIKRGTTSIKDHYHATIVLRKSDDADYFVITAYPH